MNAPQAPEMPMGSMPENKPRGDEGMKDEAGSEDMK